MRGVLRGAVHPIGNHLGAGVDHHLDARAVRAAADGARLTVGAIRAVLGLHLDACSSRARADNHPVCHDGNLGTVLGFRGGSRDGAVVAHGEGSDLRSQQGLAAHRLVYVEEGLRELVSHGGGHLGVLVGADLDLRVLVAPAILGGIVLQLNPAGVLEEIEHLRTRGNVALDLVLVGEQALIVRTLASRGLLEERIAHALLLRDLHRPEHASRREAACAADHVKLVDKQHVCAPALESDRAQKAGGTRSDHENLACERLIGAGLLFGRNHRRGIDPCLLQGVLDRVDDGEARDGRSGYDADVRALGRDDAVGKNLLHLMDDVVGLAVPHNLQALNGGTLGKDDLDVHRAGVALGASNVGARLELARRRLGANRFLSHGRSRNASTGCDPGRAQCHTLNEPSARDFHFVPLSSVPTRCRREPPTVARVGIKPTQRRREPQTHTGGLVPQTGPPV